MDPKGSNWLKLQMSTSIQAEVKLSSKVSFPSDLSKDILNYFEPDSKPGQPAQGWASSVLSEVVPYTKKIFSKQPIYLFTPCLPFVRTEVKRILQTK